MKKSITLTCLMILFFLAMLPSCTYYAALERENERELRTRQKLEGQRIYAEVAGIGAEVGAGAGVVACKDNKADCAASGGTIGGILGYLTGGYQVNDIARTYRPITRSYSYSARRYSPATRSSTPVVRTYSPAHNIPQFPWPPPHPSAYSVIPSSLLPNPNNKNHLKNVAEKLETAFDQTGYSQRKYYQVPDGFALVSQLEQFYPDGTPKTPPDRWIADYLPPEIFSLTSYLTALFTANPGRYRIIAFIVTSQPFEENKETVTREKAMGWLDGGMIVLPESIGEQPYTDQHYCTAYIYEFEQPDKDKKPFFKPLSNLTGKDHLEKSKLRAALEK